MPKNMTLTKAIIIFKNIESTEFGTDEKLTSLAMVLDMPTHNSITKDEMIKAFRWYAYTDTDSEPQTTANTAKNDLVSDIKQVKLCNNNDCTNCLSCKYEDIADTLLKKGWQKTSWISVEDRLPEVEETVLILAKRKFCNSDKEYYVITCGFYEDGTVWRESSKVCWDAEYCSYYDEEKDDWLVPKGWVEESQYEHDEYTCAAIDDFVTHWQPLPDKPKGE